MKDIRLVVTGLLALGATVIISSSRGHAENLAPNPGFESIEPDGKCSRWFEAGYSRKNTDGVCRLVTDASGARRGSRFWELENRHKKKGKAIHCGAKHTKVSASEQYVLRVWARGHGAFSLVTYGYSQGRFLVSISSGEMPIDTDKWQLRSMTFKPFMKGDKAAQVRIDAEAWKETPLVVPAQDNMQLATPCLTVLRGKVAFDDVAMYRVGHEPANKKDSFLESGKSPMMTLGRTATPPVIDGTIGEEEWNRAGAVTGFLQLDNRKSPRDTVVYACYDDEKLYFAFDAAYSEGIGIGKNIRDGKFTSDIDAIEVWILPPGGKWYQFYGIPSGGIIDQNQDDRSWNGNWEFKNKVEDSGETAGGILTFARGNWDAEISISFKELGVSTPRPGDIWRMNFCRDYRAKHRQPWDWTSWSPTSGSFANPERFGYARFAGPGPALQVHRLGDLTDGGIALSGLASAGQKDSIQLQMRVRQGPRTVLSEFREFSLGPQGPESFLVQKSLKVAGSSDMVLQISALQEPGGQPVFHTRIPFTVKPSFRMEIIPLYLKGFVDVRVDASRLPDLPARFRVHATISPAAGPAPVLQEDVTGLKPGHLTGTARFQTAALEPGSYVLKAVLVDAGGKTIASSAEPLPVPGKPEWLGNKVGITDEIPAPYKPVRVSGNTINVVERRYVLANSGLPRSIVAAGEELLAAPMELAAVVNGKKEAWKFAPIKQMNAKPGAVTWSLAGKAGQLMLKGRLAIEFDGFARWTVDISGPGLSQLDSLAFIYMLPRERAYYARALSGNDPVLSYAAALFNPGQQSKPAKELRMGDTWVFGPSGWQRTEDFFHTLWIGDDARGLSLVCETDEYVFGKRYIQIVPRGKDMEVTVHLVSERLRVKGPLHYDYAWQATPLKPRPQDPKRWHISYGGGPSPKDGLLKRSYVGLDYHALKYVSWPGLRTAGASKRRIALFHKNGTKLVPADYLACASKETEEWKLYGREWEILPRAGWTHSIQGPAAYACPVSSHFDFLTYGFGKIMGEFGFDGLYLDVSGPAACANPYHPCGYVRDGKRHPTFNLFTWRELYKRLYTYLHTGGRDGVVFRHGMRPACIAAFVDAVTQGEEWCVEREKQYRRLSPAMFRAKEMRTQFGTPYSWYTFHYYPYRTKRYGGPVPLHEILTLCLLHRVMPTIGSDEMWPIWDLMDKWWTSSEFIPYWDAKAPAETDAPNVFASTYLKKGKEALIVVGNWNFEPAETKVSIDYAALGLDKSQIKMVDALTQTEIKPPQGPLQFRLKARDLRLLKVSN